MEICGKKLDTKQFYASNMLASVFSLDSIMS